MELRQLRYFLAVAREGTYVRASRRLHVAQPALSRQIKKLEEELGVELFVRHAHGISLTEPARAIHERVQHVLDEVRGIAQETRAHAATPTGCVRIGVSPGTAEILAYPLSQKLAQHSPELRFEIVSMLMPARADLLRHGQVDFAVMNAPTEIDGLELIPLMRERLCLIHRADDTRFQGVDALGISDLRGVPLVVGCATESGVRALLDSAFAAANIPLEIAAEVNTAGASKALVNEGVAATVHVAAMARAELKRGELVAVPIRDLFSNRALAVPIGQRSTTSVLFAMRMVRDCLEELVANGKWIGARMLPANGEAVSREHP